MLIPLGRASVSGMTRTVFDIEADGLHDVATKIHCIVCQDESGNLYSYTGGSLSEGASNLVDPVGHNIIDYDIPLIRRILGCEPSGDITDTFVLSQLLYPERASHSLESYSNETGVEKIQNSDWSEFNETILERCKSDVEINTALWKKMEGYVNLTERQYKNLGVNWSEAIKLEHDIAELVSIQSQLGCPIDVPLLEEKLQLLETELEAIFQSVTEILGYQIIVGTEWLAPFTKSGDWKYHVKNYWREDVHLVEAPYTAVEFKKIQLSQHNEVKRILLELGWQPTKFTEKGSPKLPKDEEWDDLAELTGNESIRTLAKYGSMKNRYDVLSGWKSKLRPDGTIRHGAFTCGTPTARFRHQIIANIPRVSVDKKSHELLWYPDKQKSLFGTEMRSMIYCPHEGFKQVGWDLAGIELRMLAHYMNDREFIDVILEGDVHTFFWEKVTHLVASRDDWKNVFYGYSYGAQNAKLGSLCTSLPHNRRTAASGKVLRDTIESSTPSLGKLVQGVQRASTRGFLRGIDGRMIFMKKSDRTGRVKIGDKSYNNPLGVVVKDALNRLLQGNSAIVFKKANQILFNKIRAELGDSWLDYVKPLIFYHDETQSFVREDYIPRYTELSHESVREAGEYFKLNLPLATDVMVGNNWAECH
jgi:DNA polymerase-1